jgi:hypothetical protein
MKKTLKLKLLPIKEEVKESIPLFYHFIYHNKLKPGNPFRYTEFSEKSQSLTQFNRPEKPVSKIVDSLK